MMLFKELLATPSHAGLAGKNYYPVREWDHNSRSQESNRISDTLSLCEQGFTVPCTGYVTQLPENVTMPQKNICLICLNAIHEFAICYNKFNRPGSN